MTPVVFWNSQFWMKPSGDQMGFFFGECLPNLDTLEAKFMSEVSDKIGTIRDYIQTIIIKHVFRMTTSFLTPGREPSLASQLGSESWCVYIFTLMFVQKFFLCIIETIIQCRWWLWHFPCSPHACATACSAPYSPSLVSSRFRFYLISCSKFEQVCSNLYIKAKGKKDNKTTKDEAISLLSI